MIRLKSNLKASNILIDLTPLIDVVFLMLIFFIVTSDILPLKSLNIENPILEKDSTPLTTQLIVVMDAQNVIYVGSKKAIVDLVSLKGFLLQEISQLKHLYPDIQPTLVLSVDRQVEYGAFLQLFAICQDCNPRMRLVYQPSEAQQAEYF